MNKYKFLTKSGQTMFVRNGEGSKVLDLFGPEGQAPFTFDESEATPISEERAARLQAHLDWANLDPPKLVKVSEGQKWSG